MGRSTTRHIQSSRQETVVNGTICSQRLRSLSQMGLPDVTRHVCCITMYDKADTRIQPTVADTAVCWRACILIKNYLHTTAKAHVRWTVHVVRMPYDRLARQLLHGEIFLFFFSSGFSHHLGRRNGIGYHSSTLFCPVGPLPLTHTFHSSLKRVFPPGSLSSSPSLSWYWCL